MALWKTQFLKDPSGEPYGDPDIFSDLATWEAQGLSIPAGDYLELQCDKFLHTTSNCDIGGWGWGDGSSRIYIIPSPGTEYTGQYPVLDPLFESFTAQFSATDGVFRIRNEGKVTIRGIGIYALGNGSVIYYGSGLGGTRSVLDGCYCTKDGSSWTVRISGSGEAGDYRHVINNTFTFQGNSSGTTPYVDCINTNIGGVVIANNTFVIEPAFGGAILNATSTGTTVQNNTVRASTGAAYLVSGIDVFLNNVASDSTGQVNNATDAQFLDFAGGDFRPEPTNVLADAGANLDTIFPDDAVGYIRPSSPAAWTVGAYEIQAAAGAVLSAGTVTAIAQTTATIGCTTDTAGGTLYWTVTESATATAADIKAGTGVDSGNFVPGGTGPQTVGATGLTADTAYYHHWVQVT